MYITPVSTNTYSNKLIPYKQNRLSQPNFKGALSNQEMEKVIKLLAPKNTEVFENFSAPKFKEVMDSLMEKYKGLGIRSIGIQIIEPEDLHKLLGKNIDKYNAKNKFGLCIAVGDKYGPVENMNNIYEVKTFLVNDKELKKL